LDASFLVVVGFSFVLQHGRSEISDVLERLAGQGQPAGAVAHDLERAGDGAQFCPS